MKAKSTLSLLTDATLDFHSGLSLDFSGCSYRENSHVMEPWLVSLIAPSSCPEPCSQAERMRRELPRKNLPGCIHAKMTIKGQTLMTIAAISYRQASRAEIGMDHMNANI